MKAKRKGVKGLIVWSTVTAFVLAVLIVLTALENTLLYPIFGSVLGGKKPIKENYEQIYSTAYDSKQDAVEAGVKLNVQIEEEGAVLLLNEENALPIPSSSKVSVFGKNSVDLILGGTGSGGGDADGAATLFDGLQSAGIAYNPDLKKFYESSASGSGRSNSPELGSTSASSPTLNIGETPWQSYNSALRASFKEYGDAAIVVISRLGGESWDLPRTQNINRGGIEGNHYLQLDRNEYDLLDNVTARFDKVIVLLNTLTSFQCDFIEEYNNTETDKRIDAVMWIGGPGRTGAEAIGRLLTGEVNPSGKTVDIYSKDFTKDPTWINFGDNSQVNGNKTNAAFMNGETALSGMNMLTYEESVYLGYRYYETRDLTEKENNNPDWYSQNVMFPFGYGLSYTNFTQRITNVEGGLTDANSQVKITVEVENRGTVAGKDVVQLYVSKPYYAGGIEKSHVELVDFYKTDLLAPVGSDGVGGKEEVTFTVDAYDLASYDYNDANFNTFRGYELEHGDYQFIISSDSHVAENAYASETVNLANDLRFDEETVVNRFTYNNVDNTEEYEFSDFDDIQYRMSDVLVSTESHGEVVRKGMSRTNFQATFPSPLTEDERSAANFDDRAGYSEIGKLSSFEHNNKYILENAENLVAPEIGQPNSSDIILHDMLQADGTVSFDDGRWDELLKKITFGEMLNLVNNGAFLTPPIESIGKNLTNDSDGPIGFVNFMMGAVSEIFAGNATFAVEIVIGSTWNKDLALEMGNIVGECGLWGDQSGNNDLPYSGWYAPAVNLHRSPFSGRNFEYYSEDPILSGKLAVNVITGARSKGVYCDLKHFAVNDQETNRAGVSTFLTEQSLRELYLKPFEIAVKADDDFSMIKSAEKLKITKFLPATGVMSSFNRIGNKWTGGDYRLMTEVLRNEWGFRGLVISDYKTGNAIMDSRQMLYAGNDLILTSTGHTQWTDAKADSAADVIVLQTAVKNILYTVANSNSIQINIVGYATEWWITLTIVLDCLAVVGFAVWGFFVFRKFLGKGKWADGNSDASVNGLPQSDKTESVK